MAIDNEKMKTADYLFTWSSNPKTGWPSAKLAELIDRFQRDGVAEEPWRCLARTKIKPGDRAYFLKQGRPRIGIFGRGTVIDTPRRDSDGHQRRPGERPWRVRIRIEKLVDPRVEFFVDEGGLNRLSAPRARWRTQASGIRLEDKAAREIDAIIDGKDNEVSRFKKDASREVARQQKLGQQA